MNLSRLFILRPIATALLMVAILIAGLMAYRLLPTSALPEVDYPTIQVTTLYPGASPGVTTNQNSRAWHYTTAQNAVKFGKTTTKTRYILQIHFVQPHYLRHCGAGVAFKTGVLTASTSQPDFTNCVPGTTLGTLALPTHKISTTIAANVSRFNFCHYFFLKLNERHGYCFSNCNNVAYYRL